MKHSEHAQILKAFIERIGIVDLELILEAKRRTMQEAMNGNANSQEHADFQLHSIILGSVDRMLERDRWGITQTIDRIYVTDYR